MKVNEKVAKFLTSKDSTELILEECKKHCKKIQQSKKVKENDYESIVLWNQNQ